VIDSGLTVALEWVPHWRRLVSRPREAIFIFVCPPSMDELDKRFCATMQGELEIAI
jgi:guanylate kinase